MIGFETAAFAQGIMKTTKKSNRRYISNYLYWIGNMATLLVLRDLIITRYQTLY
jgi:hypothetical protein